MNDSFVSLATKLPPLESTAESGVSESMEQDVENSFGNTCDEVDSASLVVSASQNAEDSYRNELSFGHGTGETNSEVDSASFVDDAPQSTSSIAVSETDEVPSDANDVSYTEELSANSLSEPLSENASNNTPYSDNLKGDTSKQPFELSASWKNPATQSCSVSEENLLSRANESAEITSLTNESAETTSRDFNTPIPAIRIENTDGDDNEFTMLSIDGENVFVIGLEQELDCLMKDEDTVVEDLQTKVTKIQVFSLFQNQA